MIAMKRRRRATTKRVTTQVHATEIPFVAARAQIFGRFATRLQCVEVHFDRTIIVIIIIDAVRQVAF
jgi:hypothetical protein